MMRRIITGLAGIALAFAASPAAAQLGGGRGESFLTAVREIDGNKATQLLDANGSTVLSFRGAGGETALNIVARRRDSAWLGFLIGRGADPNMGDNRGETPLLISARLGWSDGATLLLQTGARIDGANRLGETPLIVAVQARQPAVVRLLLANGANPDKKDTAAGYSARDYARRDGRSGDLTRLIETIRPTKKVIAGPILR
ncbi:MAG: ankyrin repeat domain-containing protein [Sphingomicrobium sp.]